MVFSTPILWHNLHLARIAGRGSMAIYYVSAVSPTAEKTKQIEQPKFVTIKNVMLCFTNEIFKAKF